VSDRNEKLSVATPSWRARMVAAFDELGQGAKQEAAAYAGCSAALVSRIISGEVDSSEHLDAISEFLKIPPPMVRVDSQEVVDLVKVSQDLSPEMIRLLILNAQAMKR
jgi:hypothetical protein